ncbi:MAG: carboxypeptidase regulatory-like domain-containing protein [Labilithrix sp.]|nr:carboxypeptidase regulatory-like domain-containing protein [Labilithrix sp.]
MRGFVFIFGVVLVAACTSSVSGIGPIRVGEDAGDDAPVDASSDVDDSDASDVAEAGAGDDADAGDDPVFGGLPPFAYADPGIAANDAHPAHGGSVEGKACMVAGCHLGGAKPFLFAGTIYSSTTAPLRRAEIRIVQAAGTVVGSVYTDANGNFWVALEPGASIPTYSRVGVRSASETRLMQAWIHSTYGDCQQSGCHSSNTPGHVKIAP